MKKLNNKGLTLAELIVSFALVSVAMLYFYQTVSTVSRLYKKSKDETNLFSESTYTLRLLDSYCNKNRTDCNNKDKIKNFLDKINSELVASNVDNTFTINSKGYNKITLNYGDRVYTLYAKRADVAVSKVIINDKVEVAVTCYDNVRCDIVSQITNNLNTGLNYVITVNNEKLVYYDLIGTEYNYESSKLKDGHVFHKNQVPNGTINVDSPITYKDAISYDGGEYKAYLDNSGWKVKFLKSGTLKLLVPVKKIKIDAFLVGGGGSGGDSLSTVTDLGASGGGSGYVSTQKNTDFISNNSYEIQIGNGGLKNSKDGGDGQSTYAFGKEAKGGKKGFSAGAGGCISFTLPKDKARGGSGGGRGQYSYNKALAGVGGIYGQNGNNDTKADCGNGYGTGYSTDYCEFGDGKIINGKVTCTYNSIYAVGGNGGAGMGTLSKLHTIGYKQTSGNGAAGGGQTVDPRGYKDSKIVGYNGDDAKVNTGSGGGGASASGTNYKVYGGAGGSGIVINHQTL